MSKEGTATSPALLQEMFHFGVYKATQGKIARQLTAAGIGLAIAVGAWRLYAAGGLPMPYKYAVPSAVAILGFWFAFRVVNWPAFADFLIAVEAEMNKVSWPSWQELKRSSVVVILMIFSLTAVLFAYDLIWRALLKYVLGVVV